MLKRNASIRGRSGGFREVGGEGAGKGRAEGELGVGWEKELGVQVQSTSDIVATLGLYAAAFSGHQI